MSRKPRVRASDLASDATCEQRGRFDAERGFARTQEHQARVDRGTLMHARAEARAYARPVPALAGGRRCYVATALYGPDAWQTCALRDWRDRALIPHAAGRAAVAIYYAVSPALVRLAARWPLAQRCTRRVVDAIVVRVSRGAVR